MIDWRLAVGLSMESFMVGPWPSHAPMLTHPWWNNGEGMLMPWLMHGLWLVHGEHPRAKWNFAGTPPCPDSVLCGAARGGRLRHCQHCGGVRGDHREVPFRTGLAVGMQAVHKETRALSVGRLPAPLHEGCMSC